MDPTKPEQVDAASPDVEIHGESTSSSPIKLIAELKQLNKRLKKEVVERKRVEEQLQASYEYLDTILLNLPAGVAILEGPDFRYFRINRTLAELNGLPVEAHLGKTLIEVLPDAEQRILPEMRQIMDTGKPILGREFTISLPSDPDTPVHLIDYLFPIVRTDGKVGAVGAVVLNITERKEAEQALRESEEQYRTLVENIDEVIYRAKTDGTLTYASPAIKTLLGYEVNEVIDRSFAEFLLEEDQERARNRFEMLASGSDLDPTEYRVRIKSGDIRWIRVSSQQIIGDDEVVGVQGLLTDITQRKWEEKQFEEEVASAERERLARELHDAVTQTLFSASVIAEAAPAIWDKDPAIGRQYLEQLPRMLRGALAEMRTLLLELRPGTLGDQTMGQLLKLLVEAARVRSGATVTLEVEGDRLLPEDLTLALHRIAQESLNNVAKHAEANEVNVRLICKPGLGLLKIADDGCGFDPETIPSGHLGIGIMRERAQKIKATIQIDSKPGGGTFVVVSWSEGMSGK